MAALTCIHVCLSVSQHAQQPVSDFTKTVFDRPKLITVTYWFDVNVKEKRETSVLKKHDCFCLGHNDTSLSGKTWCHRDHFIALQTCPLVSVLPVLFWFFV